MKYRAFIQALASAALFGIATPFSKTLLAGLQANQLAGLLYLGAAVCLLPLVLRRSLSGHVPVPRDGRNRRNLLGAIFFGGIVGPVLLLVGLKHALAASVAMWLNLEAVATAVLAFLLFREHLGKWVWLGNVGVLAAGVLLSFGQGWAGWIGLACVAGAGLAWGLDNNFTAVIDGISPEESTFWKGLIAGTTNLAIGLALFDWRIGADWLWALLLGGVSYGASIVLYIRAAHGLGATRAQMLFSLAPFFGVLASLLWLGEGLSTLQAFAIVIMAGSLALMFLDRHGHAHKHEVMMHEHEHRHGDEHHEHSHEWLASGAAHSHLHGHAPVVHSHPHWPDLHHRHHGR
ncbi:MAG: EamA family transporter [Lentisphaeria bacterium]|jgi:drug/metabolite transporter (DMT)-like permease